MKKPLIIIGLIILTLAAFLYSLIYVSYMNIEVSYKPNPNQSSLIKSVAFGHANIFFLETDTGYIMVDAGAAGDNQNLDEAFALAGIDPQEINLIIVTHGHVDHIGTLAYAKELTGASILAHKSLTEILPQGEFIDPVPQTGFGKLLSLSTETYKFFGGPNLTGVTPDILITGEFDLREYGVNGKVIYTPGHSRGSLSVILDNGEALVGDMVRTDESGILSWGMFYEDIDLLMKGLEKIISLNPKTIYLSHGDYVGLESLHQYYDEIVVAQ